MLKELEDFMRENKITFLANAEGDLTISHQTNAGFVDYVFEEECSCSDLEHERYNTIVSGV